MRVRVTVTLDIDVNAWADAYGFDPTDTGPIRDDVREHVANSMREHFGDMGMLAP